MEITTTMTPQEILDAMMKEQAERKKNSLKKKVVAPIAKTLTPVSSGKVRVYRAVDPADLKPNPFGNTTENVVANAEDEGGKFEKRKDEGVGR